MGYMGQWVKDRERHIAQQDFVSRFWNSTVMSTPTNIMQMHEGRELADKFVASL